MQHRARRAFTALALVVTFVAAAVAVRPADAAPRAFSVPVTGALTTELVPLPLPIPPFATFAGTVNDETRTISGSLTSDPIEFDLDPSTLPIAIDGLPDAPIAFKIKLVTPSPLTGSWTPGGVATLNGKLRIDIGETTIGGLPIGILFGCYYESDVQLVGTMDELTGTIEVTDDEITVPGVSGGCAAVLGQLDSYIQGLRFGFTMRAELGPVTTSSTTAGTGSSSSSSSTTAVGDPSSSSSSSSSTSAVDSSSSSSTSEPTSTTGVSPSVTTSPTATTPTSVSGNHQGRTPTASPAPISRGSASYVG